MGLGLHGGGEGVVKFLARSGAKITVTDLRPPRHLRGSLQKLKGFKNINYVLGKHRTHDFIDTDLIVKNPGVPPYSKYLEIAKKHDVPITTDIGIFFRLSPATIIGVTGTRGKSTTAYLIWKFLKVRYSRVFLGGNIRSSVLEFLEDLKRGDFVVLELSSFQLQDLLPDRKSPHIAVLTNIMRDHINWHSTVRSYIRAKKVIFRYQKKDDFLFVNQSDPTIRSVISQARSKVIFNKLDKELQKIVDRNLGEHYRTPVALAVGVARHLLVSTRSIKSILGVFCGLEGREQYLGRTRGVHFVDDTTSTIPEATIAALSRFRKMARGHKLILIAGGEDKKLYFNGLARAIKKLIDVLILLPGSATDKLMRALDKDFTSINEVKTMKEAVRSAHTVAGKGDWILLSPGAASFGLFLNEFDRGRQFKKEFLKLKQKYNI